MQCQRMQMRFHVQMRSHVYLRTRVQSHGGLLRHKKERLADCK